MFKLTKGILVVLIFSLILIACTNRGSISTDGGPGGLSEHYNELKDLKKRATDIIEVTVLDNIETINHGDVTFTVSKAKILSSQKGSLKEGDEVRLIETGGIMPNGQEFKFNGIPVMKPGENLILFVEKYDGPVTEGAYIPLGAYQGKFIVKDNMVEQQAPTEDKLKDYEIVTKELFKEMVKNN